MTAMIGSADCPPARLAATRDGLYRVAEHLLAAARYAASGEIGLVPAPADGIQRYAAGAVTHPGSPGLRSNRRRR